MGFLTALFAPKQASRQPETILDAITYLASLASSPEKIDVSLDKVRSLTATMGVNKELTSKQEGTLYGVYLEIEHYLTTEEPLRAFTQQELRSRLAPNLQASLKTFTSKSK